MFPRHGIWFSVVLHVGTLQLTYRVMPYAPFDDYLLPCDLCIYPFSCPLHMVPKIRFGIEIIVMCPHPILMLVVQIVR
jgi:hypothetical protein